MVDFQSMSPVEAQRFAEAWVATGPERVAWLAGQVGGAADLERTADGLGSAWGWHTAHAAFRSGGEPVDESSLPAWYHVSGVGYERFTDATLWAIDGLALYWGEVAMAEDSSIRWEARKSRVKNDVDRNRPVLVGGTGFVNPVHVLGVATGWALDGDPMGGPDALLRLHRRWLAEPAQA